MTANLGHGHGHVRPRPDGMKAKCGGPAICAECARELAAADQSPVSADRSASDAEVVTADLRMVAYRSARAWAAEYRYQQPDDRMIDAVLEAVVPLIRERLAAELVAVDSADLRTVLEARHWHSHSRPGVWDDDNPPERAGRPCVECAARGRLRAAVDGDAPECRETRAEIDDIATATKSAPEAPRTSRAPLEP